MRTSKRNTVNGGVFDELALKLRQMARDEQANGAGVERFLVTQISPLTVTQLSGDLTLEDGDPDFTIGETIRDRITADQVDVGDLIWVARAENQDFHAFDVVST
jgi:hypothetical protein